MTSEFTKLEIRGLSCFISLALMFSPLPPAKKKKKKSWYAGLAESVKLTRRKMIFGGHARRVNKEVRKRRQRSVKCWVS